MPNAHVVEAIVYDVEESPFAEALHGVVKPSGGDTVVGLMGSYMVDTVVFTGQDDVGIL